MGTPADALATEIAATVVTLNGDAAGDWFEWRVDDALVCYVPASIHDLGETIADSFAAGDNATAVEMSHYIAGGVAEMIANKRLYRPGSRECGTEWQVWQAEGK